MNFAHPQGFQWADRQDGSGLDLASIARILRENWKLILTAVSACLILALIVTLLTKPLYRTWVTLEVNPPKVEVIEGENARQGETVSGWDFIITQVGLLQSRTLAERVAQDLNLAANRDIAPADVDPATRLKIATSVVAGGLKVTPPEEGQLIRFSYTSESPQLAAQIANGFADGFIESSLQRRYDASNYARDFLKKQIAATKAELEKTEKALVAYAQAEGIIDMGSGEAGSSTTDATSLQGSSLNALNAALAAATARRIEAEGSYRQAQLAGSSSEVQASTTGLRSARAAVQAEYQDKLT
ncbi:MAG: Wzz/FepE/Etk N-terminal domain-containing protein, partial [Sphingomicrobium sp.]